MARARTAAMEVRSVSAERSIAVSPVFSNAACGRTRSVARRVSGGAGGAAGGKGVTTGLRVSPLGTAGKTQEP